LRRKRADLLDVVAFALPVVSGVAFYYWLNAWTVSGCHARSWLGSTVAPFLTVPPLAAGWRVRTSGKRWRVVVATVLGLLLLTALACGLALLLWYLHHHCYE
jgi:hypothetical protein